MVDFAVTTRATLIACTGQILLKGDNVALIQMVEG